MTPKEIYDTVLRKTGVKETSLCLLHKPCKVNSNCSQVQRHLVLDFDEIETIWHSHLHKPSSASVDAMTYMNTTLCMVEIKGWKQFLQWQSAYGDEPLTEKQQIILKSRIEKQTDHYKLQNKLFESVRLCEEITHVAPLCQHLTVAFFLVTDIEISKDPLEVLTQQFNMLAETSTDWETICAERLSNHFDEEMQGVHSVQPYFLCCRDFERILQEKTI